MVSASRRVRIGITTVWLALASPALTSRQIAEAHPLHTSLAELSFNEQNAIVDVSIRVFADDFVAAANEWSRRAGDRSTGSPLVGYALANFSLVDRSGRRIAMTSCGGKRVGDLMWLCFRGRMSSTPSGSSVSNNILFDKYRDQINIVQATYQGRKTNLLFTGGEGAKRLP
jgi:hypothetical protein